MAEPTTDICPVHIVMMVSPPHIGDGKQMCVALMAVPTNHLNAAIDAFNSDFTDPNQFAYNVYAATKDFGIYDHVLKMLDSLAVTIHMSVSDETQSRCARFMCAPCGVVHLLNAAWVLLR